MRLKERFVRLRDAYVTEQVRRLKLPDFEPDQVRRYRVVFSGRVQKVGFRLEVCQLAKRLGLTGFCENLENGDVLAELQGPHSKILYLLSFMNSLKRIKIKKQVMAELAVDHQETDFTKR